MTFLIGVGILLSSQTPVSALGAGHVTDKAESQVNLELTLQGHITPKCYLNVAEKHIQVRLEKASGQRDIDFQIDCNQELHVEMRSLNGGLRHERQGQIRHSPGFTDFLPYDLEFTVDTPGARPIRVKSEDIKNQMGGGNTDTIPFQSRGNLSLQWTTEQNLFGGRYSDVIEIRTSGRGR